jgi:class 3 adenylate cyclase
MEHRLNAIMLTDISGYTAFSSKSDSAGVAAAVEQQKKLSEPLIAARRGRLVKWIGDAALVTFASVTDAILCGHELQVAFVELAERGTFAIPPALKVVVHVGEVLVDSDGDIYGNAVNVCARMEKAASPGEVYLSEAVHQFLTPAEIPREFVGEFEFKGVPDKTRIYRTCFGQLPITREHVVLVHTNFASLRKLVDLHGWDRVHITIDAVTDEIIGGSRLHGGTHRGVSQRGCLVSFPTVRDAIAATHSWAARVVAINEAAGMSLLLRTAIHFGTFSAMKYTMLGRDLDIAMTLSMLALRDRPLITAPAYEKAASEQLPGVEFSLLSTADLRPSRSKQQWLEKFSEIDVFEVKFLAQESLS